MAVVGELVGGAALGTLFAGLYDGVKKLINMSMEFRHLLRDLESTLDSLQPLIQQIEDHNKKLHISNKEIENLKAQIEEGINLVCSLSKASNKWSVKKPTYTKKLSELDASLKRLLEILKAQGVRDGKETLVLTRKNTYQLFELTSYGKEMLVSVRGIERDFKEFKRLLKDVPFFNRYDLVGDQIKIKESSSLPVGVGSGTNVPLIDRNSVVHEEIKIKPSPLLVGLDVPLKELKKKLLKNGVSMLVLTGPGGCGKTTLAKQFCQDQQIIDKFKTNIFFVTVSKKPNLDLIVQELYQGMGSQVPTFNEMTAVKWLQQFLKETREDPLLLVLDDVWSESEYLLEKLDELKMPNSKILVTSRYAFPGFGSSYYLQSLNDEDAMALFHHSASLEDKSSHIPEYLSRKIVERCKGFPLAIIVVGRSLCGKPIDIWLVRLMEWSSGISIHDSESALLDCLQSSLDTLDRKESMLKECFIDLGSFPEDQRIPLVALIDMWEELYELKEDMVFIILQELTAKNLANLVLTRSEKWDIMDGYYSEHFLTQHDMLRDLAIYETRRDPIELRRRLIIDILGNNLPNWWMEQKYQPIKARLLSISTDSVFSKKWHNMELPEIEVLLLNFQTTNDPLPEFVENMNKLKVLIVTNYGFSPAEFSNFQLLGALSNLKRIRLERISIPSIIKNPIQLKRLRKISLFMCSIGQAFSNSSIQILEALPNLVEMNIDYCDDLVELPANLCDLIHLKKLSITNCHKLSALPEEIGKLANLEVLRLRSCTNLAKLPDSITNLKRLIILDISNCFSIKELPEDIGEICSLKKLNMRQCSRLQELPLSVVILETLQEVICDEDTAKLWEQLPILKNMRIKVVKEDINLNWLATPSLANRVITWTDRRDARNNMVKSQISTAMTDELPAEFDGDELHAEFEADELHAKYQLADELHAEFEVDELHEEFRANDSNAEFKADELHAPVKADELHAEFEADESQAENKADGQLHAELKSEIKAIRAELTNKLDFIIELLVHPTQSKTGKVWECMDVPKPTGFMGGMDSETIKFSSCVDLISKNITHELPRVNNFSPTLATEQQRMRELLAWINNPNLGWRSLEIIDAHKDWFVQLLAPGRWLSDSHVDVYLHFLRKKEHLRSQSLSQCCTILDTLFWSCMNGRWEAFQNNPNSYKWDSDMMDYPLGKSPKYAQTWSEVDYLYLPVNFNNQHWVAVCADLMRRKLTIYDSMWSANRDEFSFDILKPMAMMLPSLLVQSGFYVQRPELSPLTTPFKVVCLENNIPQQYVCGDCGVFMLKFVECLSLGQALNFRQADIQLFRETMALEMFHMVDHDSGWQQFEKPHL